MRIDFHTHGKLGKKLPFCPEYMAWHLNQAMESGLDAIAMTEHYNGTDIEKVFDFLGVNPIGDAFTRDNGLQLFIGLEIDAKEGGHFLTIGHIQDMRDLYQKLKPYVAKKEHPTFKELVSLVGNYPVLFGAAHPFRPSNPINYLQPQDMGALQFLELNGKDCAMDPGNEAAVRALAAQYNLPVIAGSDTHQSNQFGCIATHFTRKITTIHGLMDAIKDGAYSIDFGEQLTNQVATAKLIKAALKAIHKLGGDYVSVVLDTV